jgi:hypothetical protein
MWGRCDVAKNGGLHKIRSNWCPEGRLAEYTNARTKHQRACKRNFLMKGGGLNESISTSD